MKSLKGTVDTPLDWAGAATEVIMDHYRATLRELKQPALKAASYNAAFHAIYAYLLMVDDAMIVEQERYRLRHPEDFPAETEPGSRFLNLPDVALPKFPHLFSLLSPRKR